MSVGPKIKEYRNKAGMTQADLASRLHVTYQAVSRWENGDVEPSIDTLREICNIFNCDINELLEMPTKPQEPKVITEEKIVYKEPKPVLAVCEKCNKPIYYASDINRIVETNKNRVGRNKYVTNTTQTVLCGKCNKERLENERLKKEREMQEKHRKIKQRRILSFVIPAIAMIILVAIGISYFVKGDSSTGITFVVIGVLFYFFLGTMILNNTFVPELWLDISNWSIHFPGVIFTLDFDGIAALIVVKFIFAILGVLVTIGAFVFATAVAMVLSLFVYPIALIKSISGE